MEEINNEKCGALIAMLRKRKVYTQKELAQKLLLSDKAISKWERGLSMPDISMLLPLSELLDITVTELLRGEVSAESTYLTTGEVNRLLADTILMSAQADAAKNKQQKLTRGIVYLICVGILMAEILVLHGMGYSYELLIENLILVELLMLMFGAWFCFLAKEKLPAFYDENKRSFYSDGFFRINISGIHFNNSNWPYILRVGRITMLSVVVLFPIRYGVVNHFSSSLWEAGKLIFTLVSCLGFLFPYSSWGNAMNNTR